MSDDPYHWIYLTPDEDAPRAWIRATPIDGLVLIESEDVDPETLTPDDTRAVDLLASFAEMMVKQPAPSTAELRLKRDQKKRRRR